jgi:hypothetical protein
VQGRAYRIAPSVEARQQWASLPPAARAVIEKHLGDIAWTLDLGHWVSAEETEEHFELVAAGYRVSYRVEPQARMLRVTALEPTREGNDTPRK